MVGSRQAAHKPHIFYTKITTEFVASGVIADTAQVITRIWQTV